MPTLESTTAANTTAIAIDNLPDFTSEVYKDAYSRINAIVIEGEKEAHDNYLAIGTLIPDKAEELKKLAMDYIKATNANDLSTAETILHNMEELKKLTHA